MKAKLLLAVVVGIMGTSALSAATLDEIKSKKVLTVGVKADYKPFGFRDPSGAIVGIEPDLAADLAKRLGVKLELVPVIAVNRMEFLQQGKIDVLMATMSDTPDRRKIVQGIDPQYYSDAVNVLISKRADIKSWEDLKDKPVCATGGSWYNKDITQKYSPQIVSFEGSEKPLFALQQGNCVGYLYDQTFIQGKLLDPQWKEGFSMPLTGIMETPWMIAVAKGNDDLAKAVTDATIDWFKTGEIMKMEEKYGIQPTEYSKRMHDKYKGASN